MLAVIIVLTFIAVALIVALAFEGGRVEVAGSSPWPGGIFVASRPMSSRPRGVQEEDLPRFVFRDRVAWPAGRATGALVGRTAPVPS